MYELKNKTKLFGTKLKEYIHLQEKQIVSKYLKYPRQIRFELIMCCSTSDVY